MMSDGASNGIMESVLEELQKLNQKYREENETLVKQVNYNPLVDMKEAECADLKARIKDLETSKVENQKRDDIMTSLVRYLDKSVKSVDELIKQL